MVRARVHGESRKERTDEWPLAEVFEGLGSRNVVGGPAQLGTVALEAWGGEETGPLALFGNVKGSAGLTSYRDC